MKAINLLIIVIVFLSACGPKTILQTDSGKPIDLSGRWNSTDAEIASSQIFNDLINSDWLKQYKSDLNYTPSIMVERFTNDLNNDLFNEQLVKYFSEYINDTRQFNLIKIDNTDIPYLILKGTLSSENFEQNDQNGVNYLLKVSLMNTEGDLLWTEDNYIKKFIKE